MIHEVLRSAATRRMAGEDVSGDVAAAMWQAAWEQSRGPKGRHAELREHGEEQLRRYLELAGWTDTTIDQVEEPVTINLDHADAAGRFDRVDTRSDGIRTVVDYKTGRPKDEGALRADLQLRAYAVGLAQREQTDEVAVEFHYLQGAVTRVVADKGFLRKAHGHLSATARELALASRLDHFRRSRRDGNASAVISARCATKGARRRSAISVAYRLRLSAPSPDRRQHEQQPEQPERSARNDAHGSAVATRGRHDNRRDDRFHQSAHAHRG